MYGTSTQFEIPNDRVGRVERLMATVTSRAVGEGGQDQEYATLRRVLRDDTAVASLLPKWVSTYRNLNEFWDFIQPKFPTYKQRRQFIRAEFAPLFDALESPQGGVLDQPVSDVIEKLPAPGLVSQVWEKALARAESDPEGAITSSKALLETTCKHIGIELGVFAEEDHLHKYDLPKLYDAVASAMNLNPRDHDVLVYKQILGGCKSVVEGLGTLRNKVGDSHGPAPAAARPARRHAALAVNLAGAMTMFLIDAFEQMNSEKDSDA